MRQILAVAMLLTACSSKRSDPLPTMCDPSQDQGTYVVNYDTVSGNCGNIPQQVVVLTSGTAQSNGCMYSVDMASDGNCRADFVYSCPSAQAGPNGQIDFQGYIQAQDPNFNSIKGELTATVQGYGACTGTYDVTWTRQ